MARPRKAVDVEKLKVLAGLGLTGDEMAAILEISKDTLERRYMDEMEAGRQRRNASLRRKQFEMAMNGNATMLVWLGKQFLGQRDKMDHSGKLDVHAQLSDEELEAKLKSYGVQAALDGPK